MRRTSWNKDEGGQAVVLIAITFLALIMAVGLAIDAGQLYVARRTMQEAADAAAYAGAVVRYQGGSVVQARSAAMDDATRNGYTCQLISCGALSDTPNGFSVVVEAPPGTGSTFEGNDQYVRVIISGAVRTALVPAQSVLSTISVRGTAGSGPLNNGYAIMALDRGNVQKSFYADNNADIHLTGGGILVNSTNSRAAWSDQCNSARFNIEAPFGTDVAGTGYGCFPSTGDGLANNRPKQADPLSGTAKPNIGVLTTYNTTGTGNPRTIDPGFYTVELGGAGTNTIYLNPGIYVLTRGINTSGNADLISNAGGVFIYNTYPTYPATFRPGIDECGEINLSGNSVTTLSAMSSSYVLTLDPNGPNVYPDAQEWNYVNFLVYQDPACTNVMEIGGNGIFAGTGTIYVPTGSFVFDGNNATLTGSQLVANTVNIQSGNITINFDGGNTAQPNLPRLSE